MSTPRVSSDVLLHIIQFTDLATLGNLRLLNKATLQLISDREASIPRAIAKEQEWDVRYRDLEPPFITFRELHELTCMDLAREFVLYLRGHAKINSFCPLRHTILRPWSYALRSHLEDGVYILKKIDEMRPKQKTWRFLRHSSDKIDSSTYEKECQDYFRSLNRPSFFNFVLLLLLLRCTITNSSERCETCRTICQFHSERCFIVKDPHSLAADNFTATITKASAFGSGQMSTSGVTAVQMAKTVSKLPESLAITDATVQRAWQSLFFPPQLSNMSVSGTHEVSAFFNKIHQCQRNMNSDRRRTGRFNPPIRQSSPSSSGLGGISI